MSDCISFITVEHQFWSEKYVNLEIKQVWGQNRRKIPKSLFITFMLRCKSSEITVDSVLKSNFVELFEYADCLPTEINTQVRWWCCIFSFQVAVVKKKKKQTIMPQTYKGFTHQKASLVKALIRKLLLV